MAAPREIEGVSSVQSALAAAREPTARAALARALQRQLHQYGVIILKRQELTRQDLMDFSLLFGEELDTVNDSPIWNVSNLLGDNGQPVGELASSELEVRPLAVWLLFDQATGRNSPAN
jgi:hypothetical protein